MWTINVDCFLTVQFMLCFIQPHVNYSWGSFLQHVSKLCWSQLFKMYDFFNMQIDSLVYLLHFVFILKIQLWQGMQGAIVKTDTWLNQVEGSMAICLAMDTNCMFWLWSESNTTFNNIFLIVFRAFGSLCWLLSTLLSDDIDTVIFVPLLFPMRKFREQCRRAKLQLRF